MAEIKKIDPVITESVINPATFVKKELEIANIKGYIITDLSKGGVEYKCLEVSVEMVNGELFKFRNFQDATFYVAVKTK